MGYSRLATNFIPSPNKNSPRNHKIDSIAIHTMAGNMSAVSCGHWFAKKSTAASSHYGIGSDGDIACYVDENDRPWTTSSPGVDHRAITIEVASLTRSQPFTCSPQAWQSLIKLCIDICRRNGISSLKWKNDKQYAHRAAKGGPVDEQNMFVHMWFANKICPGDYLLNNHYKIASEVNQGLGAPGSTDDSIPSSPGSLGLSLNIDYNKFKPYIMTLGRFTTANLPYKTLKDNGVVGAVVEAGYLINDEGRRIEQFNNVHLKEQIQELNKYGIPYGLYATCRASNPIDAREEMHGLHIVTSVYPPKLGVWLCLDFNSPKENNDNILKLYEKELIRIGFKSKIGLYVTKNQLSHITWDKFKDNWYLWIIDHVNTTSELDKLLDPEFFDMDGKG